MPESLGKQVSFSLNFDRPQDFFDPGVVDFSQFSTNVSSSEIKARIRKNLSNVEFGGGGISWLLQYIMSGIFQIDGKSRIFQNNLRTSHVTPQKNS